MVYLNIYVCLLTILTTICSLMAQNQTPKDLLYIRPHCEGDFNEQVDQCMHPFLIKLHLYEAAQPRGWVFKRLFIDYFCSKYELMLYCLHMVLSDCPTMENVHILQTKLGQPWTPKINKLCEIHSNSSDKNTNKKSTQASILNKDDRRNSKQSLNRESSLEWIVTGNVGQQEHILKFRRGRKHPLGRNSGTFEMRNSILWDAIFDSDSISFTDLSDRDQQESTTTLLDTRRKSDGRRSHSQLFSKPYALKHSRTGTLEVEVDSYSSGCVHRHIYLLVIISVLSVLL